MNIRRYDPSQPRDWRGRWVKKNSRARILYKPTSNRGVGIRGLKRNFVPYARLSTSGTTVGYNAGTIIPGRKKKRRIVTGAYFRVEHVDLYGRQKVATSALIAKPKTKRLLKAFGLEKKVNDAIKSAKENSPRKITDTIGGSRVDVGGAQVRVTSQRKFNPTITIRRGPHKVGYAKANKGIREFNNHISVLNAKRDSKVRKARPQRRKKNRKR
jgi:hypothetical protein